MGTKSRFNMNSDATKKAAKKATEKGGGRSNFKMKTRKAKLLILPSTDAKIPALFTTLIHESWANGKPTGKVPSPAFDGEDCKIAKTGWKIRDMFKESKNKKKQDLFRSFLPKESNHINVLDLDDIDAGPQVYQMSGAVAEVVLDELEDLEGDLKSICDFDEGRILYVKHNGKEKLARRYSAKFLSETAQLLEEDILDDEALDEIADGIFDLRKLQPKFDEDAYEAYYEKLLKKAEKMGVDLEDLDGEESDDDEADDDELEETDKDDDDLDFDDDDDSDDEDLEDDEVDKDDDDDEDFDFDDDDEEEKPKKKKKEKKSKKKEKEVKKKRRKK